MAKSLTSVNWRDASINMSARTIICIGSLLALFALNIPAAADNGPLYVAPGPSNLISPDVTKRSQDQLGGRAENWATSLAVRCARQPAMQPTWSLQPSADTTYPRQLPLQTGLPKL